MTQQPRIAITAAWLIVSAILLPVFLAPCLLSENALLSASRTFQLQHHDQEPCPLCGMTRAFIAISNDNLDEAVNFNQWSVALYGVLLANEFVAAVFLVSRLYESLLSPSCGKSCREQNVNKKKAESCKHLV